MSNNGSTTVTIAERAYRIWQAEGCPEGRDIDHWLQAETEILGAAEPRRRSAPRRAAAAKTAVKTARKPATRRTP